MSEEYCKSACQECNGRISLPVDAVGVEFNCPHCGVNLQLVLKHYCEHCNGPLSFEGNPDAIGMEIECGHCKNQTVLQPSALVIEDKGEEEVYEEEYDESDESDEGDEEEYDEEYEEGEDEEEYEEVEETEPERKRGGPPKPRPPKRGGPPKPRQPNKVRQRPGGDGTSPGDGQEKIGRRLAGAGAKSAEEEPAGGGRPGRPKPSGRRSGRPKPKRRTRPAGETQSSVPSVPMTRRQPAGTPEESMDPMSGAVPGGGSALPPSPAGPQPGPVVRKVAGAIPGAGGGAHSGGAPKFESSSGKKPKDTDEEFDGPWHKNPEKQKLAIVVTVVTVFVLSFTYFGLPSFVGLIDKSWERKVAYVVKLQFIFGEDYRTNNVAESVRVDELSLSINRETGQKTADQQGPDVFYVTGSARNITSDTLEQVEIIFKLYDEGGIKLGEALDYTNKLGPNVVWHFRAPCMTSEAVSTNIFRAKLDRLIVR